MTPHKKILTLEIISFVFCVIMAFVLHFLFEQTNNNILAAIISPVNESVWEHGKLVFMPFLFFAVFEWFFLRYNYNFIFAKTLALSVSILAVIVLHYTYFGILGYHIVAVDITLTVIILAFMHYLSYKSLRSDKLYPRVYTVVFAAVLLAACIIFTFLPPHIRLFYDTVKVAYGII